MALNGFECILTYCNTCLNITKYLWIRWTLHSWIPCFLDAPKCLPTTDHGLRQPPFHHRGTTQICQKPFCTASSRRLCSALRRAATSSCRRCREWTGWGCWICQAHLLWILMNLKGNTRCLASVGVEKKQLKKIMNKLYLFLTNQGRNPKHAATKNNILQVPEAESILQQNNKEPTASGN